MHSASRAMPALPGAHQSLVSSGEAAIFHARACSRPPDPMRRMCMKRRKHESPASRKGISTACHSGARVSANPESMTTPRLRLAAFAVTKKMAHFAFLFCANGPGAKRALGVWIPGLRLTAHPGMTSQVMPHCVCACGRSARLPNRTGCRAPMPAHSSGGSTCDSRTPR